MSVFNKELERNDEFMVKRYKLRRRKFALLETYLFKWSNVN